MHIQELSLFAEHIDDNERQNFGYIFGQFAKNHYKLEQKDQISIKGTNITPTKFIRI